MAPELSFLVATAATIAFVHTLFGPDHYLPFVAMAKARSWSTAKLVRITLLCGAGHLISSLLLGAIGIFAGLQASSIEWVQGVRGDMAAWALIAFGLVYLIWGLRRAYKNKSHAHWHSHGKLRHSHPHNHFGAHVHLHSCDDEQKSMEHSGKRSLAPWALFVVFLLGPCESLIPVLMYPAVKLNLLSVFLVAGVFSLVTLLTMLGAVVISVWGLKLVRLPALQDFSHAFVGSTILMCGFSITVLGL